MAAPPPTALSYSELYADAARNPFGLDEERKEMCYAAIYEVWRSTLKPMTVETLHQNILSNFSRPVGALGIFVQGASSATGVLKLVHGVQSFPGAPGQTRDRMTTLAFEGDVSGVDICTVAFEPKQLEIMAEVNVPGSTERVMQLINDEPGRETLGPFAATDANVRTTKTRGMAYFPFEFMEPLLGADITARQVFELIVPALIDAGLQDMCASLIEVPHGRFGPSNHGRGNSAHRSGPIREGDPFPWPHGHQSPSRACALSGPPCLAALRLDSCSQ
jgi:hypothetical protein